MSSIMTHTYSFMYEYSDHDNVGTQLTYTGAYFREHSKFFVWSFSYL